MNRDEPNSWLQIDPASDFSLANLPFGSFADSRDPKGRPGVAIGSHVLCLRSLAEAGLLAKAGSPAQIENAFGPASRCITPLMREGRPFAAAVRRELQRLLAVGETALATHVRRSEMLLPQSACVMKMPFQPADYVDFYSSIEHASNVGKMFRDPVNPLLPNWKHIPIGYHGRASSLVPSGVPVQRPCGQLRPDEAQPPDFGPCKQLDFELELGFVVGRETQHGEALSVAQAQDAIFGVFLLNDWSARDIQRWEYVPLGPFLAKSFLTSISPWVILWDALLPFQIEGVEQDPPCLPYLRGPAKQHFDLPLEVWLSTNSAPESCISRSNLRHLYWSMGQQLAHLTSNGGKLRVGDVCGTGTISGPTPDSLGSMLELAWKGTRPLKLASGETRSFLQDGDTVIMRGGGVVPGSAQRVGFGEVRAQILPSSLRLT